MCIREREGDELPLAVLLRDGLAEGDRDTEYDVVPEGDLEEDAVALAQREEVPLREGETLEEEHRDGDELLLAVRLTEGLVEGDLDPDREGLADEHGDGRWVAWSFAQS